MDIEALFGPLKAENDNLRICPVCSGEVVGRASKVYCCDACQRRGEYLRRDFDKERARKVEMAPEHKCEHCGAKFKRKREAKNVARFCSRECGFAARSNVTWENPTVSAELLKLVAPRSVHTTARCVCKHCLARFTGQRLNEKYCSRDCQRHAFVAANDNVDRTPRPCGECGTMFSPAYGDKRRVFCSSECAGSHNRRVSRKKRKAKLRSVEAESVDPIVVFERDRWKCQECGIKTPRAIRGSMKPNAPELDHIMPISLGGAHSYMNTQCLCRKCNGMKSDTPPMQPSLFAFAA